MKGFAALRRRCLGAAVPPRALASGVRAALASVLVAPTAACAQPADAPPPAFEVVGNIDRAGINEPSGIVFHPGRGTLFVVGDDGDVVELGRDGEPRAARRVRDADFEGITVDPATGLLYVAWEGAERVLELDPATLEVRREFAIERAFEGRLLMRRGGNGIEGIAFVPDPARPHGGTFFLAHQTFDLSDPEEASVLLEVELPLSDDARASGGLLPGRTLRVIGFPHVPDLASVEHDPSTGHLLVLSDSLNTLLTLTTAGEVLSVEPVPGRDQEGIAVDDAGNWYLAQDSGGVLLLRRLEPRRRDR